MGRPEPGEWADEVTAYAGARGFRVTTEMRTDYHRAGVLPRPRRVGQGRGRGIRALYPLGTSVQLVRLCQLVKATHSVGLAGAKLWLEGYRVDTDVVRCWVLAASKGLEVLARQNQRSMTGREDASERDRAPRSDPVGWLNDSRRLRGSALGQLRKEIGSTDFTGIFRLFFERIAEPGRRPTDMDLRPLAKSYGLAEPTAEELRALAEATEPVPPATLRSLLETLSDRELCQVRDEAQVASQIILGAFEVQRLLETGDGKPYDPLEEEEGNRSTTMAVVQSIGTELGFTLMWAQLRSTPEGRAHCEAVLGHYKPSALDSEAWAQVEEAG